MDSQYLKHSTFPDNMIYKSHLIYFIVLCTLWGRTMQDPSPLDEIIINLNISNKNSPEAELNPDLDYKGAPTPTGSHEPEGRNPSPGAPPKEVGPDTGSGSGACGRIAATTDAGANAGDYGLGSGAKIEAGIGARIEGGVDADPNEWPWQAVINGPVAAAECVVEDNWDYYLNDLDNDYLSGWQECANWCGRVCACTFWALYKDNNHCYIKNSKAGRKRNDLRISGNKGCAKGLTICPTQYCGGALISEEHVLTAAHCLDGYTKNGLEVTLGDYDRTTNGETGDVTFKVAKIKVHELYNDKTHENDIGLIKLDKPIIRTISIYPACLPPANEYFTNAIGYITGWGTLSFEGEVNNILQEVDVRVWENGACDSSYNNTETPICIKDTQMCANGEDKDSCQGDSGGPLNCVDLKANHWVLCGIASRVLHCAAPEYPGIYTRVNSYLLWIRHNVKNM